MCVLIKRSIALNASTRDVNLIDDNENIENVPVYNFFEMQNFNKKTN